MAQPRKYRFGTKGIGATSIGTALPRTMALIREPVARVLASGVAQAIMLAALGVAVLFFRYRAVDSRLVPSKPWDLLLWLSSAGFIIVGLWTVWQKLQGIITAAQ